MQEKKGKKNFNRKQNEWLATITPTKNNEETNKKK